MSRQGQGLADKLYWRPLRGIWCCFRKVRNRGYYVSLCGWRKRKRSGGQAARRPEAVLRCGRCDGLEIQRRGWEESGPVTERQIASVDLT